MTLFRTDLNNYHVFDKINIDREKNLLEILLEKAQLSSTQYSEYIDYIKVNSFIGLWLKKMKSFSHRLMKNFFNLINGMMINIQLKLLLFFNVQINEVKMKSLVIIKCQMKWNNF